VVVHTSLLAGELPQQLPGTELPRRPGGERAAPAGPAHGTSVLLTPKIGTGKRLICGPNLVTNPVRQGKISSEDSAEVPAVGSMFPFGKRTVCAGFAGSRADVAREERRDEWMDRHSNLSIKLGIKYCARSPPGVMLGQGINMNPGCM
jgi:hypothetical protein